MSIKRHHAEWLSLVEISGPFLTMPVLEKVFPQGLDAHDPEHFAVLRSAFDEWEDNQNGPRPNSAIHIEWLKFVLKQTLDLPNQVLAEGQDIPQTIRADISEHNEKLRPDFVVRNPDAAAKPRLLVQIYPFDQNLEKPLAAKHWKASPATRMMELLHSTDIRLGLVTNGEHWMLVDAPKGETTGFASWYAHLWLEEKITLQAIRSLLGVRRFFTVADDETLEAMLAESAKNQQEVTDQLGLQVRHAVEVLIQSLDRADQDDKVLAGVPEPVLYEAALTVMMRLVFLFCAEERGLLLLGDPLYDQHYAVSTLVANLQEAADQHGEDVLERRPDAWVRLLSTFRAVYGGVQHERMKLPAYSGNLFDPDRFPFLEGRQSGTSWRNMPANPLPVNNRTVLHLLRSLQYLEMHAEARRLSFRALDIEQIGHVYEGLLDHTAKRATEPILGLLGAKGRESELSLAKLHEHKTKGDDNLIEFLQEETGRSSNALANALKKKVEADDASRLRTACGNEDALFNLVSTFANLIRTDSFGKPVVIRKGSVYVTEGTDRRSSGTHYTPTSLTEPIVRYTLEPLVYFGPAEGKPKEEWKLRSAQELLDLKICDMACGSAAFLVQTCRYLSDRLMEAWEESERQAQPGQQDHLFDKKKGQSTQVRITPYGLPSKGGLYEQLIPLDPDERQVFARRIVAQRCLYGVDKNPLAVEMAKLSLWLLTLAKDRPFTFLDHAIRCGDSLVGIHYLKQLEAFNLHPEGAQAVWYTGPVKELVKEAVEIRKKIEAMPSNTVVDVEAQTRLLADAEEKTARLRHAADMLLAVEFNPETKSDRQFVHDSMALQAGELVRSGSIENFHEVARKALSGQRTLHWALEFPEVMVERNGFDAFVGNPPFMWGMRVSTTFGTPYLSFLESQAGQSLGTADLCVHFLRRASLLCRAPSCVGLVVVDTIAQGDTREVGLGRLESPNRIIRAISSQFWPGTASVKFACVHLYKGEWHSTCILDDKPTLHISSRLDAEEEEEQPKFLMANSGRSFVGHYLMGQGFVLSPSDEEELLRNEPQAVEIICSYLRGEDLNQRPDQRTQEKVINFGSIPLEECKKRFPLTLARIIQLVKPERELQKRKANREKWWQYAEVRPGLTALLGKRSTVLAQPFTTKYLAPTFVTAKQVFASPLVVIDTQDFCEYGVLQSSIHEAWVRKYASRMKNDIRYSSSDAFGNFPFPMMKADDKTVTHMLQSAARKFYEKRQAILLERQIGLTSVFNFFHSPKNVDSDIQELRDLYIEMDKAVTVAYGWNDLELGHGFHETKYGGRFTISEVTRLEVLGRLLKLNHERHAEEGKQGADDKGGGKGGKGRGKKKQRVDSAPTPLLDGLEDEASEAAASTAPIDAQPTDEIMAAFRQATRGRGWLEREELLKEVSVVLGYKRLGPKIEEALRGHLRAAIRRKIIEADGTQVRAGTTTMADYALDDLREVFVSVMHKGPKYEREEVMHAIATYLGFARLTDTSHDAIKSAINSGIRQGVLGYEGSVIWRE